LSAKTLALLVFALLGCKSDPPPPAPSPSPPEILDVHVHLPQAEAASALVAALDRQGVRRAVILGSLGVPPATGPGRFRPGNEAVLAAAAKYPDRLIPFVALEPGLDGPEALADYRRRGACGVKLYAGHQEFHDKPLDDPNFAPLWKILEEQRVPTLVHVNTVRFAEEFDRVLTAYPSLSIVCAHYCGARTDLSRLERLFSAHPRLLVDTSGGSAVFAAEGFAGLGRQRERALAMIRAAPERFLYGSDLTAETLAPDFAEEWKLQFDANLGSLQKERFSFWRKEGAGMAIGEYQGFALEPALAGPILGGNARRWLGACLR